MPAPPLNEDLQLAMALEAPRPVEAGRVTGLVEYAEELLGDHDRAVEAVRAALKAQPDGDEETLRDRLDELARDERPEPPVRLHRWLVAAGVAAGIVLTAGMLALFESTDRDGAAPAPPPVPSITPEAPSPSPTPSREKTKEATPAKDAEPRKTPRAGGPGRLSVDDSACRGVQQVLGLPTRCTIRLKAAGGPVKWSVAAVRSEDARISAEGGGKLAKGRSASVEVTVRPRVLCFVDGSGTGTVSFAPGGTATVTYTCWER
ncbi:hypothetical protein [Actinomadura sp. 6K520]|uniref:hypothetical protein n=1 Tax=Actinomadura sp. 6K520 TaxID=2530364 RepID=UPI0010509927|nr:hypothetical protein [Actinomadura sp. 6K520]TDE17853.1 hypothetical protein E1289_35730 [Actinomadura sp. 6K520]